MGPRSQECNQDDPNRHDGPWVRSCPGRFCRKPCPSGGNITGLTSLITELGGKRLELLKEAIPKLSRVALL